MIWLHPWAAWFLAGVPVIVLFYFLRLKRRAVTVSTLMFWQRVLNESSRRAFFQKLRHLFSLLLHLLIFLLILAALARPVMDRFIRDGAPTVLILDTRARMQATEPDGETRFAKAIQLARSYAHQASSQRQFALITCDATASVVVPFTGDEKALLTALDSLAPTDASGDLNAAKQLSDSLLAARKGEHQVIVLSSGTHIQPSGLPQAPANLAITRFATRRLPASPTTSEVLLEIKNFGAVAAKGNVEVALDGRALDVKPFSLEPGAASLQVYPSVPSPDRNARGWLTAKLDTADALASDNIAFATLPPIRATRVLLVSKGNWFLEKFLEADRSLRFEFIGPEAFQPALATKFDVVIFDNALPPGFDLASAKGSYLFLKASPFTASGDTLAQPLITDLDVAHPATRLVNLQNVSIVRAEPLTLPEPLDGWTFAAPLRSFDHPLLLTGQRHSADGEQRLAALAFDVADSDLPLHVAFPLLLSNILHWLAGGEADETNALLAGETLPLSSDQAVSATPLVALTKDKLPDPSIRQFFQPLHNGFYQLADRSTTRWLAVNTFSAAESDLQVAAPLAPEKAATISVAGIGSWPLWQWLALAAFVLFTVEWWLFHRRKTE